MVKVPTRLVLSVIISSRPVVTTFRIRQKDPPRGGSGDTGPVMRAVLLATLLSLTASASLHAQSLGGVARQEQEKKRKAPPSPVPSYTEEDLKSRSGTAKGPVTPPAVRAPSPSPAASAEPSPSPEPDRALLEREWRARFAEARAHIAEADARAYEDRIDVVYVSGVLVQQKVRVKVETAELRAARKALDDLEEELRRSGGLPGWSRE
jgi:hypothetical protein